MAQTLEDILSADEHGEVVRLTNEWALARPGDRPMVVARLRATLLQYTKRAGYTLWKEVEDFIARMKDMADFVEQVPVKSVSAGPHVGDRIERLSQLTDGGMSRASLHIAFADHLPLIKEIVEIMDQSQDFWQDIPSKIKFDWTVPVSDEMREWMTIYDLEELPFEQLDNFARDHGWTLDEPIHRLAHRSFGTHGQIIAVQQEGGVFFYVYRDVDPNTYDFTQGDWEVFYKAPSILASN